MKKYTLEELHKELGIEQRDISDLKGEINKTYTFNLIDYLMASHPELLADDIQNLISLGYLAGDLARHEDRGIIEVTERFPVSTLAAYSIGTYPCDVITKDDDPFSEFRQIMQKVQMSMHFGEEMEAPSVGIFPNWRNVRERDIATLRNPLSLARLLNAKSPVVLANDPTSLGELEAYVKVRKCPLIYTNASTNFIHGVAVSTLDPAFDYYGIEDREIHGFARIPKKEITVDDTLNETFIDNPYEP